MSEYLRDRIAAVQQAHHLRIDPNHPAWGYCMCRYNPQSDDDDHWWVAHAKHVADAVIAEIGLIRDPFSTVAFHRYVTHWTPNAPDWKDTP